MSTATYFDGNTLRARPVQLELRPDAQLALAGEDLQLAFPLDAIRVSDRLGSVPRFLYLPNGATAETTDHELADGIARPTRLGRLSALIHRLEAHQRFAAVACVLVAGLFGALLYYGPPKLARVVAQRMPPALEQQAGRAAFAALNPYLGASSLQPWERRRVQRALDRLVGHRPEAERPRLEFRSFGEGFPNALALPGGTIIIADQLVRLPADEEEIAAVLAHELAHVDHRHGIQGVLRNSTALLLVTSLTGDLATLSSFAASAPFLILNNGYTRDLEREADAFARELLLARGIDPKKFSSVMLKLEAAGPSSKGTIAYLSTHPTTDERVQRFAPLTADERKAVLAQGNASPQPVSQAAPAYPVHLLRSRTPGEVVVEFTVNVAGKVENPRVVRSTNPGFDRAALSAVNQWTFIPGRENFRPKPTSMQVPIQFTLDNPPAPPRKAP